MFRLGLLTVATLMGLYALMWIYGDGDPRATPRPAPASAAQDAGGPSLTDTPAAPLPAEAPVEIVPAASQTPEQVERFPGPALEPSPEYQGGAPQSVDPSVAGGPVLYVTATRVNMRSGPGTNNPVVAGLDGGAAVEPVGPTDGAWVQIRTAAGQQGYVSGQFLSPDAP